ncbi:MAG: UDP-N-acetylmuramate dehydrogenase [Clostridia bacterium]|nr:UDP-N-acetylmuramate dehydrogenase [Clostridia bacterium]
MKLWETYCGENGISVIYQAPMKEYTSFRIGGRVASLTFPENEKELCDLVTLFRREKEPYIVIGNGTNLLFADEDMPFSVISTRRMRTFSYTDKGMRLSAGVPLSRLCALALEKQFRGAENLCGIPGTVGGAVWMNAGAFGTEIGDILESVTVLLTAVGEVRVYSREECGFAYRESRFQKWRNELILSADFCLSRGIYGDILQKMNEVAETRKKTQPKEPSAGSVFRRPKTGYAGELIEKAGLLGKETGGAKVSPIHGGFIVNRGGATAKDVLRLTEEIQKKVKDVSGVDLTPEIEYVSSYVIFNRNQRRDL